MVCLTEHNTDYICEACVLISKLFIYVIKYLFNKNYFPYLLLIVSFLFKNHIKIKQSLNFDEMSRPKQLKTLYIKKYMIYIFNIGLNSQLN